MMDFHIISITFSGGQVVPLEPGNVLLLVGPNNSGKSAALREIGNWFAPAHERGSLLVIKSMEFTRVPAVELIESFRSIYPIKELPNGNLMATLGGGRTHEFHLSVPADHLYQIFSRALIQRLDTETRLTYANPVGRIDVFGDQVSIAGIHWLQKDEVTLQASE